MSSPAPPSASMLRRAGGNVPAWIGTCLDQVPDDPKSYPTLDVGSEIEAPGLVARTTPRRLIGGFDDVATRRLTGAPEPFILVSEQSP